MELRYHSSGVLWMYILLLLEYDSTQGQIEPCQRRLDDLAPGRCRKPCVQDRDCVSRKKSCKCDGICGLSCIKHNQECAPLPSIPNGIAEIRPSNQFGSVATYRCNEGYRLRGNKARVCQGDESWSGNQPYCEAAPPKEKEKYCLSGPKIPNALHDGPPDQKSFKLGSMLLYTCKPGFTINRDGVVRAWCVGDGSWVGPNMTCSNAGCPQLQDIENGFVSQAISNGIGSNAIYSCKQGFYLAGRAERTCGQHGEWEGVPPSCEKVMCIGPPRVDNAYHDGDTYHDHFPSGHQLTFSCEYGYYGDGDGRVMCNGDGQWIGLTLTCAPQSCGFPGEIEDGFRTGFHFTYPNKVNYGCNEGFELVGDSYRKCEATGRWSNTVPSCKPVTCPKLMAPVYGHMVGDGTSYGTQVEFNCSEGYNVIGSRERRCQADRTWSGEAAKCEEIDCGWPHPFWNGYLIGHKTTVDSVIFFSCKPRSQFDGQSFQTQCLDNGTWSDPPPKCWGQCQVPPIPNATLNGKHEMMFVNHNDNITFTCNDGLVPRDSSVIRCNNGTWTSEAECIPAPCPQPPPYVHNGLRIFIGQHHGNQAKYKCFAGYRLIGMTSTYLTCTFGEWKGGQPHCEEFYCPSPAAPVHGTVYKKTSDGNYLFQSYIRTIKHGDRLIYQCDNGYQLKGPSGATCVDGRWQPPLTSACKTAVHPPFLKLWTPLPNMFK